MKYIVDRIEGEIAVCETVENSKKTFHIDELFYGIKEGDHFEIVGEACLFLQEETIAARNKNIILQRNLFED